MYGIVGCMSAFAIWDNKEKELFLARDKIIYV